MRQCLVLGTEVTTGDLARTRILSVLEAEVLDNIMTAVYNWLNQATTSVAEKGKQANIEVIISLAEVVAVPRDIDYGRFDHIFCVELFSSVSPAPERVSRPGSQKQCNLPLSRKS
eukprot:4605081-Karenia_brevis.AAC.1